MKINLQMTGNNGLIDKRFKNVDSELTIAYNEIRVLEPLISSDMQKLANSLNTDFIGTEYSVKTATSIDDKLKRIERGFAQNTNSNGRKFDSVVAMCSLKDIIRYTEVCAHDDIIDIAKSTICDLEKNGYVLSGLKNYYASPYPNTGYQGVHLNFITPYGQEIELQVHSQESFDAKQAGHKIYEQIRSISTLEQDKERMKEEINKVHSSVPKPKNYKSLPIQFDLPKKEQIIEERKSRLDIDIESTDFAKNPNVMTYSVTMDDSVLLTGFESIFSDGSARSYQNNIRDGFAKYCSIDKNGFEIATHEAPPREITLDKAVQIAEESERRHTLWMNQNFADKEREDLGAIVEKGDVQNQEIEDKSIAAMDYDIRELF